jgi:hypothetical protein
MRRAWLGVSLVFTLLSTGCFFGTFQTAETLAPGEVDAGWYGNYPLYFRKADKDSSMSAPDSIGAFVTPNIGGYLSYGTTGYLDMGLRGSIGEGIGPFLKMQLVGEYGLVGPFPIDFAVLGGLGYHPVAQGITYRFDVLLSRRLSSFSSLYLGWTGVRTPDYRRLAYRDFGFPKGSDIENFRFFNALYLGVDLSRKESPTNPLSGIPLGLTMEFSVPLTDHPALFFGLQLKR